MLYVSLPFWLLMVVLTAWGVHRLWSGMVRPKVVNLLLLPGTLVAQLGHVLGLLVTGARVTNNSLYGDGESGEPETTTNAETRIPVVGPVIVGMLPLLACGAGLFFTIQYLGRPTASRVNVGAAQASLPTTLSGAWQLLRDLISLTESFLNAVLQANGADWRTWVFLYLLVCLGVRCAPLPGNERGTLIAIVALGVATAGLIQMFGVGESGLQITWALVNLILGSLLLLSLLSLLIHGAVRLIQFLRSG
jgi:hypothetical protein